MDRSLMGTSIRVLLYEFVTGGGLYQLGWRNPPAESLLHEGQAMIQALAEDFAHLPKVELVLLRDRRLSPLPLAQCEQHEVGDAEHETCQLSELASQCDWAVLIAPELEGVLLDRCRLIEDSGGRLLSPNSGLIEWTSDKSETCRRWGQANVAVPASCELHRGQLPPTDFGFPAVLKPPDGAGSMGLQRIDQVSDLGLALWPSDPMRLERFCPGGPASIALIGGPGRQRVLLPPCRQILSNDGRFSYLGGQLIGEGNLRRRAEQLGEQAASILEDFVGYVGIDLVLGAAPDGSDDVAVEINPRLTTSYVGLRHAVQENLAKVMLDLAQGHRVRLSRKAVRIQFDSAGHVSSTV
jgi:predicted ATP-grasp superfamily ATP-dependent carboligase